MLFYLTNFFSMTFLIIVIPLLWGCSKALNQQDLLSTKEPATKLIFTKAPVSEAQGILFTIQTIVQIQDKNGTLIASDHDNASDSISLSAYTDSECSTSLASGVLIGSTQTALNGEATFSDLAYNGTGTLYLKATDNSSALTTACSSAIDITSAFYSGSGKEGSLTISTANTVINSYFYITDSSIPSGSTSFTLSNTSGLRESDLVLIIQTKNTSASNRYEYATIANVSGNSVTISSKLMNSYTSGSGSGGDITQVVFVPQYTDLTVNSGASIVASPWNGTTGGIVAFRASGTATIVGTVNVTGQGFRGGNTISTASTQVPNRYGYAGESWNRGVGGNTSTNANNGAGGSGKTNTYACTIASGGSGSYATTGTSGASANGSISGTSGSIFGVADLSYIFFGPAGGGGVSENCSGNHDTLIAGNGGGIILIDAFALTVTGALASNGTNDLYSVPLGGSGAGGSIYLRANTMSLGSGLVTATGGNSSRASGGNGRIRLDYNIAGTSGLGSSIPTAGYTLSPTSNYAPIDAKSGGNAPATSFVITSSTSTANSGEVFSVTVTALDANGNIAVNYSGGINFTSSDSSATLPSNYNFTVADAGSHTFTSGVKLETAGTQTLVVTDNSSSSITGSVSIIIVR